MLDDLQNVNIRDSALHQFNDPQKKSYVQLQMIIKFGLTQHQQCLFIFCKSSIMVGS
jgi:hypothetical protein